MKSNFTKNQDHEYRLKRLDTFQNLAIFLLLVFLVVFLVQSGFDPTEIATVLSAFLAR